jgi:hypothetical protein
MWPAVNEKSRLNFWISKIRLATFVYGEPSPQLFFAIGLEVMKQWKKRYG